ncbi:MAG: DUF2867 domain-containing protein [Cyclobacteriaceae bacterium]
METIKLAPKTHLDQKLYVHDFLSDFELEDVWRVPVALNSNHSLQLFIDQFNNSNKQAFQKGLTGLLFRIRLGVGRVMGWDRKAPLPAILIPGTLRHRYAERENLSYHDLPDPGAGDFVPVYQLENEFLSEIENRTVWAALHLSRVPLEANKYSIHMAVYVRPKGIFGRVYMLLIKPFRHYIVYPALMKSASERWGQFLNYKSYT